jgi:hypothetical protein
MEMEIDFSLLNILTLVFITLKLCHIISWSWWFVFSPTLILFSITYLIFALIFLFLTIEGFLKLKGKNNDI